MRLLYQVGGAWVRGYCIRWEGPGYEATVSGGRGWGTRLYQVGGAWV